MTTKLRAASFQDSAITTAKIAADAVTNAKIADDAVQTENFASTVNLGRRNIIINGAMQIAQRATSASSKTTQGYHAVDRFDQNIATMGTYTISQSTTVPTGEGFVNSLKIDCTTADASPASGDVLSIRQRIEAQNLQHLDFGSSSSKAITLTFHVRSNKTGTYVCNAYLADAGKQWGKTYTISSADTWEKKTITWESSSNSSTINNDNGDGIILTWYLGTGSGRTTGSAQTDWTTYALADEAVGQTVNIADNTANEFYITGVQLEVGEQATPFEHRSFAEEEQLCKRYFYQSPTYTDYPAFNYAGTGITCIPLGVHMRATPSITDQTGSTYYEAGSGRSYSPTDAGAGKEWVRLRGTVSGGTSGYAGTMYPKFKADAEL